MKKKQPIWVVIGREHNQEPGPLNPLALVLLEKDVKYEREKKKMLESMKAAKRIRLKGR